MHSTSMYNYHKIFYAMVVVCGLDLEEQVDPLHPSTTTLINPDTQIHLSHSNNKVSSEWWRIQQQ